MLDTTNTSGFGTPDNPPLVAIYTSAYSPASPLSGGRRSPSPTARTTAPPGQSTPGTPCWTAASADFRDPKVFWYDGDAGGYWVMVAVEATDREVVLYKSADLKTWEYLSTFGPANATGGVWECPDLFELPVDGDAGNTKWVLVVNLSPGGIAGGSGGQYFLGTFDGVAFASETTVTEGLQQDDSRMAEYGWLDWGRDYYAAVSFTNAPDGRRLMIGWMNNWQYGAVTPTSGWRSAMSLVRDVRLATPGRPRGADCRPLWIPSATAEPRPTVRPAGLLADGTRWLPAGGLRRCAADRRRIGARRRREVGSAAPGRRRQNKRFLPTMPAQAC